MDLDPDGETFAPISKGALFRFVEFFFLFAAIAIILWVIVKLPSGVEPWIYWTVLAVMILIALKMLLQALRPNLPKPN